MIGIQILSCDYGHFKESNKQKRQKILESKLYLFLHFIILKMQIEKIFLLLLLALLYQRLNGQSTDNKTILPFNSTFELHLQQNEYKSFSIIVPWRDSNTSDLFIHSMPKYSDPFQVPYLTITSGQNYSKECFSAAIEFAGICHIESQELIQNRTFMLGVRCATSCDIIIHLYESPNVVLELGSNLKLTAYAETELTQIIETVVPNNVSFTGLAIMAVILNLQQNINVEQDSVNLFINYGNNNISDPEENKYQLRGESLNGGGKGAFIYKHQIKSGNIIKCYLKIQKNVSVRFSIISMNDQHLNIDFGKSYFDYVSYEQPKMYSLNTTSYNLTERNKTIEIVFDIYSGNPDFIVAFDANLTNPIQYNRKISAVSILLPPEVRNKLNFTDMIYMKVTSRYVSQYYFYTSFIRDDVTFIEPYLAYLDEIPKGVVSNYLLTQTFKYQQESNDIIKNYSFKVEVLQGNGSFYFKRCPSFERKASDSPSFTQCLVQDPAYFKSNSFYAQQIQQKNILNGNLLTISLIYNITKCTRLSSEQGFIIVKCAFLMAAVGESSDLFEFSLLPERNYFTNYLRENKVIKEYIPKDNYAFYVFSLPQIQSVQEINIFVTTFSGDTALIVSSTDRLPTLESNSTIIKQSGGKNNIVLGKDKLAAELYISVYAYQFTEINIGVIVHRSDSNSSVHVIPLVEDNIQTYTLNKTQPIAYFIFNSRDATVVTVLLNQLSGHVQISVIDALDGEIECQGHKQNPLICQFLPENNKNYSVKVIADIRQQNKFTITYKTQKRECFSGKLNQPLYVTLTPNDLQCYQFNINRQISIIFAASFTHLQLFDHQITTNLLINNHQFQTIEKVHKIITMQDMINYCPMGLIRDGFPDTCELTLLFSNQINSTTYFSFIMEEEDVEIALFDGINEKIRGQSIQIGNSKNFYYPVSSALLIQIFFTTRSLKSHYFLASKFVSKQTFLSRNKAGNNIFLPYVAEIDRTATTNMQDNYYSVILGQVSMQRLTIDSKDISSYCPGLDCYLIISIYPEEFTNSVGIDEDQYEIEISQEETYLTLGTSKIGMLNKGQYYTYLVDPYDAIIQFKQINSNQLNTICLSASAALSNGTIIKSNQFKHDLQVSKSEMIQKIFVKGQKDYCSFEIKYISNENPYQSVLLSHPYDINVVNGQTVRLIYYHQNRRSFRIIEMASAGDASIFVMPIYNINFTLSSLNTLSYNSFPTYASYDGEYVIEENHTHFCSDCYYYVIVTTRTKFVGQVVFLRTYDPIPLTTNHIFKTALSPNTQQSTSSLIFYSLTTFNLTFNVLSGKIEVNVFNPAGTQLVKQQISEKTSFNIKSIPYKQKQKVQYYSEKAKFKVLVNALIQTEFYIEVSRHQISSRIFQGYPSSILIESVMSQTIEFINSQSLDKPLNLMVDINEIKNDDVLLEFTVTAQTSEGKIIGNDALIKNITKSDNTYMMNLANIEGRYFLAINTNIAVNITLLLIKTSLTYLSPKHNYLLKEEGIYQVYSNNKNILAEIFNCQGEINLIGSQQERKVSYDYQGQSQIKIKRPNYGGHYVFGLETNYTSYYIRINNKFNHQNLEYLINYYYYEAINPYDAVDALSYDITHQFKDDGLHFSVKAPTLMDAHPNDEIVQSKIDIKKIVYYGFASASKFDLDRYSKCSIEGDVVSIMSEDPSNIFINTEQISKLTSKNKANRVWITVEAIVFIEITSKDSALVLNSPNQLTFFYNSLEISTQSIDFQQEYIQTSNKYWFTDNLFLFIGWMIILIILVLIIPYYLLKLCIRRLMMRQQNLAQEMEMEPNRGNQTRPTEEKIVEGSVPHFSSQPIIKENI